MTRAIIDDFADGGSAECPHAAAAAHSKKMYDRISGLAKIGVWECDLGTGNLTWTDAVYDLFELPRGSAIDRDEIVKLYEPGSRSEMERLRAEAIAKGTGFALDVRICTAAGNERWVRLTADIEQKEGRSVAIFGTKQDISAERAAQEKLQSLQTELIHASRVTAMGAMASTLAHEVNQPLAAASNYLAAARRLAERETVAPSLSESIEGALNSTLRAGEIIRRVRAMTRKEPAIETEVELEPVVREAVAMATAGSHNLSISTDIVPAASVKADRIQVQQVLINLIGNACLAAAGKPCQIAIGTMIIGTELEVRVSDTGPGIPDHLLPRVFESFVTGRPDGLGIGLSISRTIVEAHGGRIRAENLPTGGASVCFTLPLWPTLSGAVSGQVTPPARVRSAGGI